MKSANHSDEQYSKATNAQIKLLVFDMGHVLVDFDFSQIIAGFCDLANISQEEGKEIFSYLESLGYETGTINTIDFVSEINNKLKIALTINGFHQLWNHTFQENLEMAILLADLRKCHPLYLLSNTNESHFTNHQRKFNIARHFNELILSHEIGILKPDLRIYEEVLNRSKLKASECLFIDDLDLNVQAANKLGMSTIKFVGVEDLKIRLSTLKII